MSTKIARRTITGDGFRVVNKDTHFIITRDGAKVRVKQGTNDVARTAHACADIVYFKNVWDETMAQDAKNKKQAERQLTELKKVEAAAKNDIPIEQRIIKTPNGLKRVVWVMPWWKRALRWLKGMIMPAQVEVPLPGKVVVSPTGSATAPQNDLTPAPLLEKGEGKRKA